MSRHISHNHIPELRLAQIRPFPNWLCSARLPRQIGFVLHDLFFARDGMVGYWSNGEE
jgi:hypothetical protein